MGVDHTCAYRSSQLTTIGCLAPALATTELLETREAIFPCDRVRLGEAANDFFD